MSTDAQDMTLDVIQQSEYLRQRLAPQPGDMIYLHLLDLRDALREFASDAPVKLLDYGCGGSPYRSLFPNAVYHRADYVRMDDMDFQVLPTGHVPDAGSNCYDIVLSTQVLEHVASPSVYLAECLRVLKPGGLLVLTTHGMFPDHGCPYDFWRWTADGLKMLLRDGGFEVSNLYRLTCGVRAILFWVGQMFQALPPSEPTLRNLLLRSARYVYRRARPSIDRLVASQTASQAKMTGHTDPCIDLCVALLASARKPE